jgi:hypothetical protein
MPLRARYLTARTRKRRLSVGREIIFPSEIIVVHPGRRRNAGIYVVRNRVAVSHTVSPLSALLVCSQVSSSVIPKGGRVWVHGPEQGLSRGWLQAIADPGSVGTEQAENPATCRRGRNVPERSVAALGGRAILSVRQNARAAQERRRRPEWARSHPPRVRVGSLEGCRVLFRRAAPVRREKAVLDLD